MYEAPQFGTNGWLTDLTPTAEATTGAYQLDDMIPRSATEPVDEGDVRVAVLRRVVVPDVSQDVLEGRRHRDAGEPDVDRSRTSPATIDTDEMAGICLRGKPGWGDLGASFTTVLNTFGGTWWSGEPDGSVGEARGRPARVQEGAPVLRRPRQRRRRGRRRQRDLQRVPRPVPRRQGGDVVRRDRRRRPARGRRQRGEGQERLRPGPGQGDRGLRLALEVGARHLRSRRPRRTWPGGTSRGRPDRATSRRPGPDPRRVGGDPAGHARSTYEIPEYQEAARAFADQTSTAMEAAPIDNPGTTQAAGEARRAIRRHPGVPGRRQPVHRAVLRGNRRPRRRSIRRSRTARTSRPASGLTDWRGRSQPCRWL